MSAAHGTVLETGLHASLNAGLRRLADTQDVRPRATPMPRRLLLGSHDIEAFAAKMARWPSVRDPVTTLATTGHAPADLAVPGGQGPRPVMSQTGSASAMPSRPQHR